MSRISSLLSWLKNYHSNLRYRLQYISEPHNWVIDREGKALVYHLDKHKLIRGRVTDQTIGLRNQLIHFGSEHTIAHLPHPSNKIIISWYHFIPESPKNEFILNHLDRVEFIHTSASKTKKDLVEFGIPESKIEIIPLGIDLQLFKPGSFNEKEILLNELNIPPGKKIIGSFQKDGNGWGEGLEPKLIKGPDLLVKTLDEINKSHNIHVLLVGPARGYVKEELKKRNIPFHHIYLEHYKDIAQYYKVCDLCLVTSRIEGGPKQVLEAMASRVPVVTTNVGLVTDIGTHKKDMLIADTENINQLVTYSNSILTDKNLSHKIRTNALDTIKEYSWDKITLQYYNKLYAPLL